MQKSISPWLHFVFVILIVNLSGHSVWLSIPIHNNVWTLFDGDDMQFIPSRNIIPKITRFSWRGENIRRQSGNNKTKVVVLVILSKNFHETKIWNVFLFITFQNKKKFWSIPRRVKNRFETDLRKDETEELNQTKFAP